MEVYSECQQNDSCKTEDDAPQRRQRKPFFQSDGCIDQKSGNGGSQRNGISDGSRAAGSKGVKTGKEESHSNQSTDGQHNDTSQSTFASETVFVPERRKKKDQKRTC